MAMRHRHAVVRAGSGVENGRLGGAHREGSEEVNPIAEDNRRRVALAGKGDFPDHVARLAPMGRGVGQGRNSIGERSTPTGPCLERSGICLRARKRCEAQQKGKRGAAAEFPRDRHFRSFERLARLFQKTFAKSRLRRCHPILRSGRESACDGAGRYFKSRR
jgi:hypothetical protein